MRPLETINVNIICLFQSWFGCVPICPCESFGDEAARLILGEAGPQWCPLLYTKTNSCGKPKEPCPSQQCLWLVCINHPPSELSMARGSHLSTCRAPLPSWQWKHPLWRIHWWRQHQGDKEYTDIAYLGGGTLVYHNSSSEICCPVWTCAIGMNWYPTAKRTNAPALRYMWINLSEATHQH